MVGFYNHNNIYLNIKIFFLISFLYNKYAKKTILDTFTLQEIEKDMRMYMWVEVNRYHRKPKVEEEEDKKKTRNESNYIQTHVHKIWFYILMKQLTQ
jgi:predicted nucleotidyltransferase component of viral defense system